ncbi:MAG: hypothetical protein CMC55_05940 [Flavobacteriaceae bacterium]|nr:hypothetical protein [Flavobacteriaceae bacterium]
MAENKKSFIAYSDWNGMFKALPDDVAGKLIKHIFAYVNDEKPECDDYIINALFEQIKATLKRDLEKWDSQRAQRVEAGKKSAKSRAATKSNERSTVVNEKTRKPTVSVSVSVNVSDNVNDINKRGVFDKWIQYRKDIKKPITVEATLKALVKKFNETSFDKLDHVVNNSIENTYQGLIWDSYKGEQKKGKIKLSKLSF